MRLVELLLHHLNFGLLFMKSLSNFNELPCQLRLLLPHIVLNELLALLKNRIKNLKNLFPHRSELITEHLAHSTAERVDFEVYVSYFTC